MDKPQQAENRKLFETLIEKSTLKLDIYENTLNTLKLFKQVIDELTQEFKHVSKELNPHRHILFESHHKGEFGIEMKFGGDVLFFLMHTNIFEFSRDHEVMRTPYVRDDKKRSYCGIINIYNFLADSFKYNRYNDIGYLIGRVFINNENHYFIEGKRELGFLFNDFGKHEMKKENAQQIIEAAINYTINFDLLTPPYESVKLVNVSDLQNVIDTISLKTGKRLGFRFQEDTIETN
jgi:hypothetical protein